MSELEPSPTPRHVGFLIDRWEPERGGAERALARLATHLVARGHEVSAFALSASPDAPGRFLRVPVGEWGKELRRSHFERRLARALVDAAAAARCDVTVGIRHLPRVDVYWPHGGSHRRSWMARRRARGRDPESAPTGRHRVFLDFERRLLAEGGARAVVCVSELVRDELAQEYPAAVDRLVVVPNGIDLDRFHPDLRTREGWRLREDLGIPEEVPLIAFAARDPRLKGIEPLFAALAGLRERRWIFVAAGLRHPRRWERHAVRAGLDPGRLRIRSTLPAPALFAAADLTVHPTWRDTSALVVLESLATGTPVITTAFAGAAAWVTDPRAGTVLDDPGDVSALRAAIATRLEMLDGAAIDREVVRAAVGELGVGPWLARLEEILLATCCR